MTIGRIKIFNYYHEINSISINQIKIQLIEASLTVIARLIHINYVTIVLYQMFLD